MFDSGIAAKNMIEDLKNEIDAALPIPNSDYVLWLNELEQLVYTEIIKEEHYHVFENLTASENLPTFTFELSDIATDSNIQNSVLFGDICGIYNNDIQLIRVNNEHERVKFKYSYWYDNNSDKVCIYIPNKNRRSTKTFVYYYIRPALKKVDGSDNISDGNVMLPIEFVSLAKAKLRAEAYKVVNEGGYAANWLSEYNYGLENFKLWIENKKNSFGK